KGELLLGCRSYLNIHRLHMLGAYNEEEKAEPVLIVVVFRASTIVPMGNKGIRCSNMSVLSCMVWDGLGQKDDCEQGWTLEFSLGTHDHQELLIDLHNLDLETWDRLAMLRFERVPDHQKAAEITTHIWRNPEILPKFWAATKNLRDARLIW